MVLGSRRRVIPLAASALAAVVFAAAMVGRSCGPDDDSAEATVRSFIAAANAGDRQAVYELLGPGTRARLDRETARATDLVGGATRFEKLDLIGLGKPSGTWVVKRLTSVERGGQMSVDIEDADRNVASLPVVKIDGQWRVEIPGFYEQE